MNYVFVITIKTRFLISQLIHFRLKSTFRLPSSGNVPSLLIRWRSVQTVMHVISMWVEIHWLWNKESCFNTVFFQLDEHFHFHECFVVTYPNNSLPTLSALRSEILLVVVLTEELTVLLHKAYVDETLTAVRVGTQEVIGTPALLQCKHERPSGDSHKWHAIISLRHQSTCAKKVGHDRNKIETNSNQDQWHLSAFA